MALRRPTAATANCSKKQPALRLQSFFLSREMRMAKRSHQRTTGRSGMVANSRRGRTSHNRTWRLRQWPIVRSKEGGAKRCVHPPMQPAGPTATPARWSMRLFPIPQAAASHHPAAAVRFLRLLIEHLRKGTGEEKVSETEQRIPHANFAPAMRPASRTCDAILRSLLFSTRVSSFSPLASTLSIVLCCKTVGSAWARHLSEPVRAATQAPATEDNA